MIAAGIADPAPATRARMALGDRLLLRRLTVDPTLYMRPTMWCAPWRNDDLTLQLVAKSPRAALTAPRATDSVPRD